MTNIRVNADPGLPSAVVTWEKVTSTDNSGSVTLTSNFQSGDNFPIGNTDVVYTAIDQSGIISTVRFVVIVEGNFIWEDRLSIRKCSFVDIVVLQNCQDRWK